MPDTVYLLLGSERYYPAHDNTLAVFDSREAAEEMRETLENASGPGDTGWKTLREKYDWLPKYAFEHYSVESYPVR